MPTLVVDCLLPEQTGDVSRPRLFGGQAGSLQHKSVPRLATAEPDLKVQVVLPRALSETEICHLCDQERDEVRLCWGWERVQGLGKPTLKERL